MPPGPCTPSRERQVNTLGTEWLTAGDFAPPPEVSSESAPTAAAHPLLLQIDSLVEDLRGQDGYVLWSVAEIYNRIVREAGLSTAPAAQQQAPSSVTNRQPRARMTGVEMRTHLNQLRIHLHDAPPG
jgi:hypothetical protein